MPEYRMLINGQLVGAKINTDVINPATEKAIASCPRASEEQLNEAVAAAKAASASAGSGVLTRPSRQTTPSALIPSGSPSAQAL